MSTHSNSTDVAYPQPTNSLLLLESLTDKATEVNSAHSSKVICALLDTLSAAKSHFERLAGDSNSLVAQHYLTVLGRYLGEGVQMMDEWPLELNGYKDRLRILTTKLDALVEVFPAAMNVDPQDLFCLEESHDRWQALRKITEFVNAEDCKALKQDLDHLATRLAIGGASLSDGLQHTHGMMRKLQVGADAFYYLLFRSAAIKEAPLNRIRANVESVRALWGMMDSRLISPLYQSLLVSICCNTVVFVPRASAHVMDMRSRPKSDFMSHAGKHYIEQMQNEPASRLVCFSYVMDHKKRRIPVRILSPFELPLADLLREDSRSCFSMCCDTRDYGLTDVQRLILHFHGGGFVSMSSNSHQNYTRKWARDTSTPVLSVDYRLSPEHRYPDALDDCWQVYSWLREYAKKYLGITPNKIILAGDSAGGNLALGVTLRCIKAYGKIPDGLLLSYPSVSLDRSNYTPSLAFAMEDSVLPYSFFKLVEESYLKPGDDPKTDPFLSPLLTEKSDLEQFPPVRMLLCSNDPLADDCERMAEKLLGAGVDVKVAKFQGMVHGALNFDLAMGVRGARHFVRKGSEYLNELLSKRC